MENNEEDIYSKEHGGKKTNVPSNKLDNVGWKIIPKDSIPCMFRYNKKDDVLRVKACDFEHIKHYSMMNENDPQSVDEHINEILMNNCKIGTTGDYRDLTITSKLHVFFTIRDYTLMNNESNSKIYLNFTSTKGEKAKMEINANAFEYFDIPKGIDKWYDENERCFVVKHEDFSKPIKVYVPKVGVINSMKKYAEHINSMKQNGENVYLDKNFVVYSQYLIDDWRKIDEDFKYIDKIKEEFESMSPDELQTFDYVVDKLKIGIKPTVKVKFDSGNVEVFPMIFREYKSLFYISNKIRTLFED